VNRAENHKYPYFYDKYIKEYPYIRRVQLKSLGYNIGLMTMVT